MTCIFPLSRYSKGVTALGCKALSDALPKCHELQFLCLNGNENIRDTGCKQLALALTHCKKLRVLEMLCCGLGDEGAKALAKGLPSCFLQGEVDPAERKEALLDLQLNAFTNAGVGKLHRAWHQRGLGYKVTGLAISLDPDCATRVHAEEVRTHLSCMLACMLVYACVLACKLCLCAWLVLTLTCLCALTAGWLGVTV